MTANGSPLFLIRGGTIYVRNIHKYGYVHNSKLRKLFVKLYPVEENGSDHFVLFFNFLNSSTYTQRRIYSIVLPKMVPILLEEKVETWTCNIAGEKRGCFFDQIFPDKLHRGLKRDLNLES